MFPYTIFSHRLVGMPSPTDGSCLWNYLISMKIGICMPYQMVITHISSGLTTGELRRVQLAMGLMRPWTVLLLDEVTVDLDVLVRSDLLNFLQRETESRPCTIIYCTHIFDGLAGWPTHLLKISLGKVMAFDSITEVERISQSEGYGSANSALYEVCLAWLKEDKLERGKRGKENRKKWRDLDEEIRGPEIEKQRQSTAHTPVERWRLMPS